ncbi:MAG: 2-oxo acid dehydrogenase subunit E2 [Candidatus Hydrogenedentes bacterium]|nr:2-oxo acid dehydrogenase subunit E2 [Candidatus Hydrogenedentota bacterium]
MKQVPFDLQRRVVTHKTVESWQTVPHGVIIHELDVTRVMALTREWAATPAFSDVRLTVNSVVLLMIARALRKSPVMNAHVECDNRTSAGVVTEHEEINIAIPLHTLEERMITPTLKNAGQYDLQGLCRAMEELRRRVDNTRVDLLLYEAAMDDTLKRLRRGQLFYVLKRLYVNFFSRSRVARPSLRELREYRKIPAGDKITPEDLLSATVLVSNPGSMMPEWRGHVAMLMVIPPQVVALGLGAIQSRPAVVRDETGAEVIAPRRILPLTICGDHRVMDFSHVTAFMRELNRFCEHPEMLLHQP